MTRVSLGDEAGRQIVEKPRENHIFFLRTVNPGTRVWMRKTWVKRVKCTTGGDPLLRDQTRTKIRLDMQVEFLQIGKNLQIFVCLLYIRVWQTADYWSRLMGLLWLHTKLVCKGSKTFLQHEYKFIPKTIRVFYPTVQRGNFEKFQPHPFDS